MLRLFPLLSLILLPLLCSAEQLTVSAAASLADAFKEIGVRFEAARPGVTLRLNVAASGVLVQQIVQGAPVDVFASADAESIERGVQQQVLDAATRRDFARNALVLIVPAQDAPAVSSLQDLRRPEVRRIALGQPATVPVGRYAKQALDAAGLWAAVQPRLVFGQNVRQVLDYVARGEADAGFVYRTDAASAKGRVRILLTVGGAVTYPAAVVRDSRQPALAREFVAFLAAPVAQAILVRHGFDVP